MKNITLLSLLALVSCSVFKTNSTYSGLNKLTFTVESKFEQIPEMTNQIETYLENLDSLGLTDSFKIKFQKLMNEKVERELKYPNEIYIEAVGNDWQRQRYIENKYTNKLIYRPESDSIYVIDSKTNEYQVGSKLKRDSCSYRIEVDKTKRKAIYGYNCYFIKLEEFSGDKNFRDLMGSTVYEMWVTTKINIPIYLLLKNECIIDEKFFPLETKKYQSKSKNNYQQYNIKKIE